MENGASSAPEKPVLTAIERFRLLQQQKEDKKKVSQQRRQMPDVTKAPPISPTTIPINAATIAKYRVEQKDAVASAWTPAPPSLKPTVQQLNKERIQFYLKKFGDILSLPFMPKTILEEDEPYQSWAVNPSTSGSSSSSRRISVISHPVAPPASTSLNPAPISPTPRSVVTSSTPRVPRPVSIDRLSSISSSSPSSSSSAPTSSFFQEISSLWTASQRDANKPRKRIRRPEFESDNQQSVLNDIEDDDEMKKVQRELAAREALLRNDEPEQGGGDQEEEDGDMLLEDMLQDESFVEQNYAAIIRTMFRYRPDLLEQNEGDLDDMEASASQMQREERRSKRVADKEDREAELEEQREIMERQQSNRTKKKRRREKESGSASRSNRVAWIDAEAEDADEQQEHDAEAAQQMVELSDSGDE